MHGADDDLAETGQVEGMHLSRRSLSYAVLFLLLLHAGSSAQVMPHTDHSCLAMSISAIARLW